MANAKRSRRTLKASDRALFRETPAAGYTTPLELPLMPELTKQQRIEISQARKADLTADTQAALDHPSTPTPLQLKRLAYSEAKKAALKAKSELRNNGQK